MTLPSEFSDIGLYRQDFSAHIADHCTHIGVGALCAGTSYLGKAQDAVFRDANQATGHI